MTDNISEEASMQINVLKSDNARQHWRDVLDQVAAGKDVIIERYNKPLAAIIPYEVYLALLEEIDEWRIVQIAKAELEEYRRDASTARPWEEVKAELIADGLLDAEE
jgi:prevent-host-death family protein